MPKTEAISLTPEDIQMAIERIELEQDRLWDGYVLGMMRLRQQKDSLKSISKNRTEPVIWDFSAWRKKKCGP